MWNPIHSKLEQQQVLQCVHSHEVVSVNTIHSMHSAYNHLCTPTNAHIKILSYP
jgi:hypothetical protein